MARTMPGLAPLLGGLGGFFGGLVFISVGGVVGQSGFLTLDGLRIIAVAALYDALIAPLVFPVARRAARVPDAANWRIRR